MCGSQDGPAADSVGAQCACDTVCMRGREGRRLQGRLGSGHSADLKLELKAPRTPQCRVRSRRWPGQVGLYHRPDRLLGEAG